MSMKVRGAVLLARKSFVIRQFGEEGWNKVLDAIPVEEKQVLSSMIIHAGWYPFELGEELDQIIVKVLGKGNPRVFEEIGAQSAVDNLNGIHQTFLTPGDPQAFMKQARSIYKFYYDTGSRTYDQTGPTSGVMTTHNAETLSAVDCLTVIGWYRTGLEMCGAKNVRVKEVKCRAKGDAACEYHFNWG
ncbi:DUF2378 family protein [candidate division KSB1 bacterium]|nr:DUF2378 family protein [candidate division KSB1 bacterium]